MLPHYCSRKFRSTTVCSSTISFASPALSSSACEALTQEDEPRRHQPQLHPAALTRRVNTTRHAIMEQQRPTSPPRAQERAAGAQIYVARLGYSCPSSHRPITQLTSSALGAFSPASFYTPPVCDCVICLKFVSGFDGRPMSWSISHFQHELFTLLTCLFLLMHSFPSLLECDRGKRFRTCLAGRRRL